jgi:hypothetical protein
MEIVIDEIVREWSENIPSGIIDLNNEDHFYILSNVLEQKIENPLVVHELMGNIRKQMREDY